MTDRDLFVELMEGVRDIRRFREGELKLMVTTIDTSKHPWKYKRKVVRWNKHKQSK